MGLLRRLFMGESRTSVARPEARPSVRPNAARGHRDDGPHESWYVPSGADLRRFIGPDGLPALRLVPYRSGENVLRLCEDATGLLVGPADRRLTAAGVLVSNLRGESYDKPACRAGDFSPGAPVELAPEPENPHDDRAVAVYDASGRHKAAYMNKQKARAYLKRLHAGETLGAISLRGTSARTPCEQIAILVATPQVIAHLRSPRPRGAPRPAHLR
jgi:hypothetical protein